MCAALGLAVVLAGCGIYVVTEAPNPPDVISLGSSTLTFYGLNDEDYFLGYNLWYRYSENERYLLCRYQDQEAVKPTLAFDIPVDESITVDIDDLRPTTGNKSFKELYEQDEIDFVYFAVSSYGLLDGLDAESVRVLFGRWPVE